MSEVKPRTSWKRRVFAWGIALAALAFAAWMVPIRDRCVDPRAPASTKVMVSRQTNGDCVLHIKSGDVTVPAKECAELSCEPGLASTFEHANAGLLAALAALYIAATFVWAARWRLLLTLAGVRLSWLGVWRVTVQAQAGGIMLPGGVGGDALRIAAVVGKGAKTSIVVASVLLDRALGLTTVALLAAAFGLFGGGGGGQVTYVAGILAMIPIGFVLGLVVLRSRFAARLVEVTGAPGIGGKIARTLEPVLGYLRSPGSVRAISLGFLASLVNSGVQLVCIRGIVWALGASPAEDKWVYIAAAMGMIVGAIPALPGAWGTADAAYVFFLGQGGFAPSTALAVSLLYRLFWYLSGVLGAVLYMISGASRAPRGDGAQVK